jgi:mono/diheme cytochrome c family protein
MSRGWRPVLAGAVVVVAVFLLSQWPIFEPDTSDVPLLGNPNNGAEVFADECAGCHGDQGEGGSARQLAGSGLDAETVAVTIAEGTGVMPAGLVSGQDEADVIAYVVSIGSQQP